MLEPTYKIKVSPEVIKGDLFVVQYTGGTAPVYSSMTQVLSGGANGESLLTGLTIPVLLLNSYDDIGYYSPFDGNVVQNDVTNSFIYSATSANPYTYYLTNTSDIGKTKFLGGTTFFIDWGDGSSSQSFNIFSPNILTHNFPTTESQYVISMSGFSDWGIYLRQVTISTPFTGMTIPNPLGNFVFIPYDGIWSSYTTNLNYIFTGDSNNTISAQTSDNYTTIPFIITGNSFSRLGDLSQYGTTKYKTNIPVTGSTGSIGVFLGVVPGTTITSYTIDNVFFYDYEDGTTIYSISSSGLTANMLVQSAITKEEAYMGVVMEAEVQTNVFVERGKNTALERIQRLGEVDNIGDLEKYGYSFFELKTYN